MTIKTYREAVKEALAQEMETSEGDWRPSKSNGFIRGVYSLCFFQLYASPRDDMGQPNFIATQNLESLTSSMKTPTYPPMKVASHSL